MTRVREYLFSRIEEFGSIHISLIDPEEFYNDKEKLDNVISIINRSGSSAIMVGGSTVFDRSVIDDVILRIKRLSSLPVIIFPNDVTSISHHADAIWFMSLLNSLNPYYITGAQMRAAPVIYKSGIEPLSMAYLVVGEGKTVGYMGYAHSIPLDEPKILISYCLAAEFFGFDFIYIEAGSGAEKRIYGELVSKVKRFLSRAKLVVGGGIRSYDDAYDVAFSGADIIVTGNILESRPEVLIDIVRGVHDGGKNRLRSVKGKS